MTIAGTVVTLTRVISNRGAAVESGYHRHPRHPTTVYPVPSVRSSRKRRSRDIATYYNLMITRGLRSDFCSQAFGCIYCPYCSPRCTDSTLDFGKHTDRRERQFRLSVPPGARTCWRHDRGASILTRRSARACYKARCHATRPAAARASRAALATPSIARVLVKQPGLQGLISRVDAMITPAEKISGDSR